MKVWTPSSSVNVKTAVGVSGNTTSLTSTAESPLNRPTRVSTLPWSSSVPSADTQPSSSLVNANESRRPMALSAPLGLSSDFSNQSDVSGPAS